MLEAHARFNVLSGDNGQGKTNLLEAVYLVGTLRSFRAAKVEELVRFGEAEARVRARVEKDGVQRLFEVRSRPGHKTARIDGKGRARGLLRWRQRRPLPARRPAAPTGAPSGRRRFLDRAIFGERPGYAPRPRPTSACSALATRCCATAQPPRPS